LRRISWDEGRHWRDAIKKELSSFDALALEWAKEKKKHWFMGCACMISERKFISAYTSIWRDLLPMGMPLSVGRTWSRSDSRCLSIQSFHLSADHLLMNLHFAFSQA